MSGSEWWSMAGATVGLLVLAWGPACAVVGLPVLVRRHVVTPRWWFAAAGTVAVAWALLHCVVLAVVWAAALRGVR